jgi:hypothetical protein
MPGSESIAWACVVWLLVGAAIGAWLRGRGKPKRRRATPIEVAEFRNECERNRDLEQHNSRLLDHNMALGVRVWELEEEAKKLRDALRAESRFYRIWNAVRGRDVEAGAAEGMGV